MNEEKQNQKKKRRCNSECQEHLFALNSPKGQKLTSSVKFCPKYYRQPRSPQKTFPQFNNDHKFYTSGFILGIDRKTLQKNQGQELAEYNRQVGQTAQKNKKIVFPKPRKTNTLCYVCKNEFKNYFKHIMSSEHKEKISKNEYNIFLVALTDNFKQLEAGVAAPPPIEIVNSKGEKLRSDVQSGAGNEKNKIIELIISSDSSADEDYSSQQNKEKQQQNENNATKIEDKKYPQQNRNITMFSSQEENSLSNEDQTRDKDLSVMKIEKQSSESVEIVKINPPKQPRNQPQESEPKTKQIQKKKSKDKKKQRKNKKKKKKSRSKRQRLDDEEDNYDNIQRRKNSTKRRPLDPPPADPPLIHKRMEKMAKNSYRGGQRPAHPAEAKSQEVLIEKHVVNDPVLDQSMQKILSGLVFSVNKGPPAQAPRKYRTNEHSSLPKTITRSRINTTDNPCENQAQNSYENFRDNSVLRPRQSQRSQQSVSESNSKANLKKDEGKFLDVEHHCIVKQGWEKLKRELVAPLVEEQKKKNQQEVIEVAGDDSDLSETGKDKQSQNEKNTIDKKIVNDKRNQFFISNIYDPKIKPYPVNSDQGGGRIKIFQKPRHIIFRRPAFPPPTLFRKKLDKDGEVRNLNVIDLSTDDPNQCHPIITSGVLLPSQTGGQCNKVGEDVSIIARQDFFVSEKK